MAEGVIGAVLTLNFDLAITRALTELDIIKEVAVICRPEDHQNCSAVNVVYLHRNVDDPNWEAWVLRSEVLEKAWQDGWQEMFAIQAITAPVTVFAGLGTPTRILVESAQRVKAALPNSAFFMVDPIPKDQSQFFTALGVASDSYVQESWTDFMVDLAGRVLEEHRDGLAQACYSLIAENGWADEDVQALCDRMIEGGLVFLGQLRARWLMKDRTYPVLNSVDPRPVVDLLLVIPIIERATRATAKFRADGAVEFWEGHTLRGVVTFAHGQGTLRRVSCEQIVGRYSARWVNSALKPTATVVAGVVGNAINHSATPENLVSENAATNIVNGTTVFRVLDVEELRNRPQSAEEVLFNG
jgi:hypothetical protein